MKRLILLIFLSGLLSISCFSQWYTGGSFGYSKKHSYTTEETYRVFFSGLNAGRYLNDNWLVGFGFSGQFHNNPKTSVYAAKLFFRYYLPLNERISVFNDFYIQYSRKNIHNDLSFFRHDIYSAGFLPGFSFRLTERFDIEVKIANFSFDYSEYDKSLNFGLNSGQIGVVFRF